MKQLSRGAGKQLVLIPSEQGNVLNRAQGLFNVEHSVLIPSEQGNVLNSSQPEMLVNQRATSTLIGF